jgi:uncharacterized membrane protein
MRLLSTPLPDLIAFGCFLASWLGFGLVATWLSTRRPSLMTAVSVFRERWMRRICKRDTHIADATLLSNLLRGALFFASTTVFILGGLIAVLGTGPKLAEVVAQMPHSVPTETWLLETKSLILIAVYVYAFFKFTWSAWQYNVLSILVGAAPTDPDTKEDELTRYVDNAAHIATLAGDSYNKGIRAYYFSIPLMAWFIDPRMFLAVTLVVAFVLYRREFASPMLHLLEAAGGGR